MYFVCESHSDNIKCSIKMVIKLVVTFIYFSWPKCFAVEDAINARLPPEEATHLHCKRRQPHDPRTRSIPPAQEGLADLLGRNGGWGVCPGHGKVGWLLLRKRLWWTGWKILLGWGGNPTQKHQLMQQRRKCLSQVSSCCVSAASPSPFSSRGLSALLMVFSIIQPAQKPCVVWVRSVLWEEKQVKTEKEKGRTGKMLLLTFSPGFSSGFLYTWSVLTGWSKFLTCWLPSSRIF